MNYKSHYHQLQSLRGLALVVALMLGLAGLVWWYQRLSAPAMPPRSPVPSSTAKTNTKPLRPLDIVESVNQVRQQASQPLLQTDSRLFKSALAKANDMCDRGYFSHESPTGLNPWYWLNQSQFEFAAAGENLARNVTDLDELIATWASSPTHQQNMVDPRFTVTGVALRTCVIENQETLVVVQHFASQTGDN